MTETQVAWGSVVVKRVEKSEAKDLDSILLAIQKQQVFISRQRTGFRNKSAKWWSGEAGSGLCVVFCEFLLLQSSHLPCCELKQRQ